MQQFTCGNPEMLGDGSPQARLPSNNITFQVVDDLPGFSRSDFEQAVWEAWKRWERVIGITVDKHANPKTDPTQIVTVHSHDGNYGVLADQQLPYGKGTNLLMRVDRVGPWIISDVPTPGKVNLIATLAHEHGHCLGFMHASPTDQVKDLMDPMIQTGINGPQAGDIALARRIYGVPNEQKPAPPSSGGWAKWGYRDENGVEWIAEGKPRRVA